VKTASNSLGTILVDSQGMTLYHLSGEQNGKFICTGTDGVRCPAPAHNRRRAPRRKGYLTAPPEALIAYHVPPNDLAPT
jgi:hypothetical protein